MIISVLAAFAWTGCSDDPVDDDGLLITSRRECYVGSFNLLGVDRQTVVSGGNPFGADKQNPHIDTTACTIDVQVFYGTDLKNLYPQFSLVTDAKLEPKVEGLTDFSDLANPRKYTVISGNREVRKEYTIRIVVQQP